MSEHSIRIATLTLIEEIEQLPLELLLSAYDRASEWLAKLQSAGLLARLNEAARKVITRLRSEKRMEGADVLFKGLCFPDEILKFEHSLISAALAKSEWQSNLSRLAFGNQLPTTGPHHRNTP